MVNIFDTIDFFWTRTNDLNVLNKEAVNETQ